jgi:hypothetical protein
MDRRKEEEIPLHEVRKRHGNDVPRNLNLASRLTLIVPLFSGKAGGELL